MPEAIESHVINFAFLITVYKFCGEQARQEAKEASLAAAAAAREHENALRALQRHLDLDFKRDRARCCAVLRCAPPPAASI